MGRGMVVYAMRDAAAGDRWPSKDTVLAMNGGSLSHITMGIGVHLSRCLQIAAAGRLLRDGLAVPSAELIQDRGPTTPVRISPATREQVCKLLPAPLRRDPSEVKGLGDGLAGDRQLQRQAPGV
jgi:hypothetical protein